MLLHPGLNYYAFLKVHALQADMFFLSFSLYAMMQYFRKPSLSYLLFFSLITGVSCLMRPTLIVIPLTFLLCVLTKRSFASAVKITCIPVLFCLFALSLWIARNYYQEGIIGISSETGEILWAGIIKDSEGGNYLEGGKIFISALTEEERSKLYTLSAKEQNDFYMKKYLEQVNNKPLHVLKMYALKLRNFWLFRPQFGNKIPGVLKDFIQAYKVFYYMILFFAVLAFLYIEKNFCFCFPCLFSFFAPGSFLCRNAALFNDRARVDFYCRPYII